MGQLDMKKFFSFGDNHLSRWFCEDHHEINDQLLQGLNLIP